MLGTQQGVADDRKIAIDQNLKQGDTTSNWKNGGIFSLSLAQAALINWAAGGENTFAVNGLIQ